MQQAVSGNHAIKELGQWRADAALIDGAHIGDVHFGVCKSCVFRRINRAKANHANLVRWHRVLHG